LKLTAFLTISVNGEAIVLKSLTNIL
jgi:hypothetical protein